LAGLTKATCVIEATDRSGTSSTAREALNMNRIVAGVPGSIHSPTSLGVNTLLKHKDVHVVTTSAELQELVSGFNPRERGLEVETPGGPHRDRAPDWRQLSETDYEIWELLPKRGGIGIDILCQKTGRSRLDLLARLSELHLAGMVTSTEGVWRKYSSPN
jgi:DNA processing protein